MPSRPLGVVLLIVAGLTGCASTPRAERQAERRALFERHAGDQVDSIRSFTMDRFETLGPDAVAVWASPARVYLLTVRGPCVGLDQRFSLSITSTNRIVRARFDAITFTEQPSRMIQRCPIATIRPVDFAAVRAEGRDQRKSDQVP
jgi:Family of unknown function (DUF6491)